MFSLSFCLCGEFFNEVALWLLFYIFIDVTFCSSEYMSGTNLALKYFESTFSIYLIIFFSDINYYNKNCTTHLINLLMHFRLPSNIF